MNWRQLNPCPCEGKSQALLAKPRPKLTSQQGESIDPLKKNCPGFAAMRTMVLSFQGILQNRIVKTLHDWLERATASGLAFLEAICTHSATGPTRS